MRSRVSLALFIWRRMATRRVRACSYPVFPGEGRRVIDRATIQQAEAYELAGIWRREYDTMTGKLVAFRLEGVDGWKMDGDLKTVRSSSTISHGEMELNLLRSRTFMLSEEQRLQLIKDGRAPEDVIERAKAKIRVYVRVGAAKGDILRAWPR
jgi:hypothetical protein